ncbi:hypothetical protein BDV95DRAFT_582708 [Massariosphaeria phaeospora]|uniref:Mediator of RNA polymerase II transcription subunit 12 n=1 Tax=Massariosphaeria phaeospora TaxID=100035 RepID=A0A7C8I4S2_9PLEO|nr:hypothetical protein BDV95DRAFT_582708 [Massariosphaeria phaeospora]
MTSRPGLGIHESLQHRGSGGPPRSNVRRRSSKQANNTAQHVPQLDCIDPALDSDRRPAAKVVAKGRGPGSTKSKPAPLDGLHTSSYDGVRPAPRGKPPLFFSMLPSDVADVPLQSPQGQTAATTVNLPVPPRPGSSLPGGGSQTRRIVPGGTGVKHEHVMKLPSLEAPAVAMVFSGGKTADLFPWIGNHPEDTLSEGVVKNGFSNKVQIMNETNTARPGLWPTLKSKSGLSTLSTLFVAVLDKRQSCGRVTSTNTFKPPPRLTLRDSTRETWLHDLANPTIGLRRLSRTIPHGITGKVLLEQCLNKNIPIPRALWLAKCVGINEMRAHKRKGQPGTNSWVRGWTIAVEQFLDVTIASIGQMEWKPRITYALQLVTHLYKEHLLEADHFLEWILSNLETCLPERLFIWLLLISINWTDLTISRRRGKRLAEYLLCHAEKLYQVEEECPTSPLLGFLENTISRVLVTQPSCLLKPQTWGKHRSILDQLSRRKPHPQLAQIIASLDQRNRWLSSPMNDVLPDARKPPRCIYNLLDAIDYTARIRIEKLAFDCMEFNANACSLIGTVLRWASSLYREGSHRVYLVTRLIRRWGHEGADVDGCILSYLHSSSEDRSIEHSVVFRVVAELVRSKTFSIGKYLQWLIASGALTRDQEVKSPSSWALRLITEIPLSGLPEQIRNLRYTLLRGTAYTAETERLALDDSEETIRQQMPDVFETDTMVDFASAPTIQTPSATIRLELGAWLRQQVAAQVEMVERVPTKDPSVEGSGIVCRISPRSFHVVRSYLESFGDFSILADVIGIVATSLDCQVLASAADTLHYNHRAFRTVGAFEPLFDKVAMRYAAIRTVRFPDKDLLVSLKDLAHTARADDQLMQLLAFDLSRYEQKNSAAACSPASDNMADAVPATVSDAEHEIDRILSSGTTMDQQIMTRVFNKIVHNLEELIGKSHPYFENQSVWFHRLRMFNESTFEGILSEWVASLLDNHYTQLLSAALPPLVTSGCLTLSRFLEVTKFCTNKHQSSHPEEALGIYMTSLAAVLPSEQLSTLCQPQDAYRYRLEQQKLCQDPAGRVITALQEMLVLGSGQLSPQGQSRFNRFLSTHPLVTVVRYFAIHDTKFLSRSLDMAQSSSSEETASLVKTLLVGLIDPLNQLGLNKKSPEQQISVIVNCADDLSLPFCQLHVQQLFSSGNGSAETTKDTVSAALLEAVRIAVEKDQSSWPDIVAGLSADLTSKLRAHAERETLDASASVNNKPAEELALPNKEDSASAQKYFAIVKCTPSPEKEGQPGILPALVERLKGVLDVLILLDDASKDVGQTASLHPESLFCTWLNVLLHLALVHGTVVYQKVGSQHQAALLWTLRSILIHPILHFYPLITQRLFDIATLISDSLSDEARFHLARADAVKSNDDARCAFIFGTTPSPDGWLILTKPAVPSTTAQPVVASQTQPQHATQNPAAMNRRPSQQPQGAGYASLQRAPSQQYPPPQIHAQQQQPAPPHSPYPHHAQQPVRPVSRLQRLSSNTTDPHAQFSQLQQMQQNLAQQRSSQTSPAPPPQRQASYSSQPPGAAAGKPGVAKQMDTTPSSSADMRMYPFAMPRWEVLPESSGNPAGNETAISLSLFGARRV